MTAQDEIKLKAMFDSVHSLLEGLQAQVTSLREELATLQKAEPAIAKKAKAKEELPTT